MSRRARVRHRSLAAPLPHVHRVVSILKQWLPGTRHGAVTHEHLDYYLDELTCRLNRRHSRSRGMPFFRLAQQAVVVDPASYESLLRYAPDAVSWAEVVGR